MKKLVVFFMLVPLFLPITESRAVDAFVTENLNFRTGPGTQYARCGLIPAGRLVFVKACKGNWCHVQYNTKTGWVSARYLSFKDANDLYHIYTIFSEKNHIRCDPSP
ncbi:uncharacterized protein YraI [Bartonella silvatica]|uniref:Uncharacterized protein YraI n=1 Tax=Bartonella silvatica TaxID=357760 RepID=A0ABV2HGY9_9HYPH